MESVKEEQNKIIEEFELFDEWDDKYGYLIELGKKLAPFPEQHRSDENKIKGCQSQVWMHSFMEDNKVNYLADSDAVIVKGLVSLLIRVYSGKSPDDIVNSDLVFLDKIGLKQHLSPTRSNGLASMVKQMKLHALAYQAKMNNNN